MMHRLGFKGYALAWGAGVFYVLMFITSPTEVGPATVALIKGVVGAANAAGDGVGQAHEDFQRQELEAEIRAELTESGWRPSIQSEPVDGDGPVDDAQGDDEQSAGPLPSPDRVWQALQSWNTTVEGELEERNLRAGAGVGS